MAQRKPGALTGPWLFAGDGMLFSHSRDLWDDFLLDMVKCSTQCPCLSQLIGAPLDGPGHIGPKQLGNFLMVWTCYIVIWGQLPMGSFMGYLVNGSDTQWNVAYFFSRIQWGPKNVVFFGGQWYNDCLHHSGDMLTSLGPLEPRNAWKVHTPVAMGSISHPLICSLWVTYK